MQRPQRCTMQRNHLLQCRSNRNDGIASRCTVQWASANGVSCHPLQCGVTAALLPYSSRMTSSSSGSASTAPRPSASAGRLAPDEGPASSSATAAAGRLRLAPAVAAGAADAAPAASGGPSSVSKSSPSEAAAASAVAAGCAEAPAASAAGAAHRQPSDYYSYLKYIYSGERACLVETMIGNSVWNAAPQMPRNRRAWHAWASCLQSADAAWFT